MTLKSVELFCGIGGFRIGCDELGIETIWSNEIDKLASKVYVQNFGSKNHINDDINKVYEDIPDHDLLTAGFPCQPFSSAGKKLGINDTRGTLFESINQILKKKQPRFFVLENVKRLLSMENGRHFAVILKTLSQLDYIIEWRILDAVNFGLPQSRERIVITGRKTNANFSYLCNKEDLLDLRPNLISNITNNKLWQNIEEHTKQFFPWGIAKNGKFFHAKVKTFSSIKSRKRLKEILEKNPDESFYFTSDTLKRIENSSLVNKFVNGVQILYNQKGGARMGYTIFGSEGIAPTLTCTTSRHYERYKIGNSYRRLTNVEYARIQGFPDHHCSAASIYRQYSLYGNAVPPQLAKWAINQIISQNGVNLEEITKQLSLL